MSGTERRARIERDRHELRRGAVRLVSLAAALACGACGSARTPEGPHNVLLVTLDTTRADALGAWGEAVADTPRLDALAAEGVRFARAATSAPLTLPAHTSLMTGRYPFEHGVRDNAGYYLADGETTLAEALAERGYATFAVVGAFVLHGSWGLDQGFAGYDDRIDLPDRASGAVLRAQRDGAEVVERALAMLDAEPRRPFFAWVHFYDPHTPYRPPEPFASRYPGEPYHAEVAYLDSLVGRLFDGLAERGLWETTWVVVVGDHGEGLGEHREPDHGIFLYQPTLHVPLIVRAPGGGRRGVVERLVRDIDVMPTVLDLVGTAPPAGVRGESLRPLLEGRDDDGEPREHYAEALYGRLHYGWAALRSLCDERFKYVEAPRPELYDLGQDPGESYNAIELHPEQAERMRARLQELAPDALDTSEPAAPLDPQVAARLRSLGYLGGTVSRVAGGELPDPKDRAASLALFADIAHDVPEALRQDRPRDAIELLEPALEREPAYLDGWRMLAEARRSLDDHEGAAHAAERGLALAPEDVGLIHELARAHAAAGRPEVALDLLDRARSIAPRFVAASYTAAEIHETLGQDDAAIAALRRVIEQDPDVGLARYEIGRIWLRRGRFDEAERFIAEGLAHQPRLFGAHYNLALISERRGRPDEAERRYRAELDEFPDNHEAWTNLGVLLASAGRFDEAAAAFERVIQLEPDLSLGHYLLARAWAAGGRQDEAVLRAARRAVELDPASERARRLLAQLDALR